MANFLIRSNYFPLLVRAGPDDRHRVWCDRPGHGEDLLLVHEGHEGELLSISSVDFLINVFLGADPEGWFLLSAGGESPS